MFCTLPYELIFQNVQHVLENNVYCTSGRYSALCICQFHLLYRTVQICYFSISSLNGWSFNYYRWEIEFFYYYWYFFNRICQYLFYIFRCSDVGYIYNYSVLLCLSIELTLLSSYSPLSPHTPTHSLSLILSLSL